MATAGSIVVNLIAKTGNFEKRMRRSRKRVSFFSKSIMSANRQMVTFAAGFVSAGYAVSKFANAIKVASNAVEVANKFNVVFGEQAASVRKWATEYGTAVGRARVDMEQWLSVLQDTFVPVGFARKDAAMLSKSLVQLGIDLGSFNDKADDETIGLLTSALMGNHRALRSYGIMLTEAGLQQESYNSGLNKTFNELTNLQKVFLRYRVILNSSKDAQGDAIRTMDTFANQVKRMQANIKDLSETVGKKVIPTLNKYVKVLSRMIKGTEKLSSGISGSIINFAKFAAKILAGFIIFRTFIKVIMAIRAAYIALATAQSVTLALAGPAGWAVLAVGAAIATASVVALTKGFKKAGEEVDAMSKEIDNMQNKIVKSSSATDNLRLSVDDLTASLNSNISAYSSWVESLSDSDLIRHIDGELRYVKGKSGEVTALLKKMGEDLLGESLGEGLAFRLKLGRMGATEEQKDAGEMLMEQKRQIEKMRSLKSFAEGISEDVMTPYEKFSQHIDNLSDALDNGFLSWEQYTRAVKMARKEMGQSSYRSGSAMEISRGVTASGLQIGSERNLESLQKENNSILREIERNTKRMEVLS